MVFNIPLFIYRTWMNSELPKSFERAWKATAAQNPGFSQVLFTDADMNRFMYRHFANEPVWNGAVYRAFDAINPLYGTARADLFRYALIYKKGGVYMDAKSMAGNISSILRHDDDMVVARWPYSSIVRLWSSLHLKRFQGEFQQWWLAASPRHPALKEVIDVTLKRVSEYEEYPMSKSSCAEIRKMIGDSLLLYLINHCKGTDILYLTGPFAFTEGIEKYLSNVVASRKVRILWPDGDGVFIYDYIGDHRSYGTPYFTHGSRLVRNRTRLPRDDAQEKSDYTHDVGGNRASTDTLRLNAFHADYNLYPLFPREQ